MAEAYIPQTSPFWTDDEFRVYEYGDRFTACRHNGAVHFRGTLQACAEWIIRERSKGAR